jgi:hypothetical protein
VAAADRERVAERVARVLYESTLSTREGHGGSMDPLDQAEIRIR